MFDFTIFLWLSVVWTTKLFPMMIPGDMIDLVVLLSFVVVRVQYVKGVVEANVRKHVIRNWKCPKENILTKMFKVFFLFGYYLLGTLSLCKLIPTNSKFTLQWNTSSIRKWYCKCVAFGHIKQIHRPEGARIIQSGVTSAHWHHEWRWVRSKSHVLCQWARLTPDWMIRLPDSGRRISNPL